LPAIWFGVSVGMLAGLISPLRTARARHAHVARALHARHRDPVVTVSLLQEVSRCIDGLRKASYKMMMVGFRVAGRAPAHKLAEVEVLWILQAAGRGSEAPHGNGHGECHAEQDRSFSLTA